MLIDSEIELSAHTQTYDAHDYCGYYYHESTCACCFKDILKLHAMDPCQVQNTRLC